MARERAAEQELASSEEEGEEGEGGEAPVHARARRKRSISQSQSEDEGSDEGDEDQRSVFGSGHNSNSNSDDESIWSEDDERASQSDVGFDGASSRGAAPNSTAVRLSQGLNQVPGYSDEIMGKNIDQPIAPTFETGISDYWTQWTSDSPLGTGTIRPCRVLKVGFIAKWQMAKDAEYVGDIETQSDPGAQARTVATCAMMGLQTMGTAKGFICSKNHSEITNAQAAGQGAMEEEDLKKLRDKFNGRLKSYTYCPDRNSNIQEEREVTAQQFCWGACYCYDEDEKFTGINYFMLIFDKGFSNEQLVHELMNENNDIKRNGTLNGIPEALRRQSMERQNKIQRGMTSGNDLEKEAATLWKRICTNSDYIKMLESVGGQTPGNAGRPYYADIKKDTPPGCTVQPFQKFVHDEYGGRHPFGPSVSHNHKRFVLPNVIAPGHPGVNVHTAGMLDAKGKPLGIHPSLRDPRDWYDAEGNFEPPQHVKDNGWFYICHDAAGIDLFKLPLPAKMHGSVEPGEILLRQFWDLNKDTSPILKKAQERGKLTYEENRDAILALFHHDEDAVDPDQARLNRAVNDTDMLCNDSLDKTAAEEAKIEFRSYGETRQGDKGAIHVISVREILREHGTSQEKVHAMVQEHDKRRRAELRDDDYAAQQAAYQVFDAKEKTRKRQREHAEATDAAVRLGLQKYEHAYERKKAQKMIPPGWRDVCHLGLHDALKMVAEVAKKRESANCGRVVNPNHPNASDGTANVGQAFKKTMTCTDFSLFGQSRAFLMYLLSSGVRIAGSDVKLMTEAYIHAFEPFQDYSFFYLMCGTPGTGKSMRAKRLQQLLCDGWVKGSGSGSAKAGMNGGFDFLCGRLVYYDEITADFASQDSDRVEYLKSITMEQRVVTQRTVKVAGENGLDTFVTVVIDSLHFESHLICTNCGPLGLKADVEPSTNRKALSDRSWAHMVPPAGDDAEAGNLEFDLATVSDSLYAQVAQFRVHTCLTAYVLAFIKHVPSCQPNLTYANMLTNKWYEMLDHEFNFEQPTKRKKLKLRMMFILFCVESAIFEKFEVAESGLDYEDMQPDEHGHLAPFVIEMLADVIRSLQRCLDLEVILTAWSHSLDHSTQTCAHMHQLTATLASLVGNDFDRRTLEGELPPTPVANAPAAPASPPAPQGLATEEDEDLGDEALNAMMDQFEGQDRTPAAVATEPAPPPPAAAAAGPSVAVPLAARVPETQEGAQAPPPQPQPQQYDPEGRGPPTHELGHPTLATAVVKQMMGERGKTRKECMDFANEMEMQRQCRSEMSKRALSKQLDPRHDAHAQLTKLFTDGRDRNKEPMHRMQATGKVISAKRAAGACMPNAGDVISRGMTESFLTNIVSGLEAKSGDFDKEEALLGTSLKTQGWEYKRITDAAQPGPADFDFAWAKLKGFTKTQDSAANQGAGGDAKNKKSVWTTTAGVVKRATKSSTSKAFTLIDSTSMSAESMRDTFFLMKDEKKRIPQFNHNRRFDLAQTSRMLSKNQIFSELAPPTTIHPHFFYDDLAYSTTGKLSLANEFVQPTGIERPIGSSVGRSPYQKRLDHLTQFRALPVCITPESFKKGSMIEECESFNGVYINKHIASETANLLVEIAHYLSTVPGIAGGKFDHVPDSYKSINVRSESNNEDVWEEEMQEAEAEPGEEEGAAPPQPREPEVDNFPALNEEDQGQEEDAEEDFEEQPGSPEQALSEPPEDGELEPMDQSVSHPDSDDLHIRAAEGAAGASAALAADPGTRQETLPYEWDQLAMFMTCKAIDTLHNDCRSHVKKVRAAFPDVFDEEEEEETMASLPQVVMRFPGLKEKNKLLWPLSRPMPLKESRKCDMESHLSEARASKELTEAVHSIANGRMVEQNDPEVLEYEAETRGIDASFSMSGNIFARSTWQRFTLSALEARGMLTDKEANRVNDQGLGLRWRARNHRAVAGHDQALPWLDVDKAAKAQSFAAQERRKRKSTQNPDVELERHGSVAAKKRALELARSRDMLAESLDAPVMA